MIRPNTQKIEVAQPQMSPYGLLSPAVKVIKIDSDWWLSGAIHELYDGGVSYSTLVDMGSDPDDVIKEMVLPDLGDARFVHIVPVTIEARVNTSTIGVDVNGLESMAKDALELVQQKAIEEAFWQYMGSKFRSLPNNESSTDDEVVRMSLRNGTALSPRHAQAVLEGAVADHTVGYEATLHFPRLAASNLRVKDHDGVLKTVIGSNVIAGSGYSNTDETGSAHSDPVQRTAYATGPMTVVLGKTEVFPDPSQRVNTSTNTAEVFAQRPALIAFSTKNVFSVLVDTTLDF